MTEEQAEWLARECDGKVVYTYLHELIEDDNLAFGIKERA